MFLFDEPFSNLDARLRVQLRREICRLHHRLNATMLYVTHDQVEAMTLGDRIAVMRDGVIQQVAAPVKLYDQPENIFVAGFIGSPPMNFFHGTLAQNGSGMIFQETDEGGSAGFASCVPGYGRAAGKPRRQKHRPRPAPGKHHGPMQSADCEAGLDAVETTVETVEPMGAETHCYAR